MCPMAGSSQLFYCLIILTNTVLLPGVSFCLWCCSVLACAGIVFMQHYSRDYSSITRDLYGTDHFPPVMLVENSITWITLLVLKNAPVLKMYCILLSDIKRQTGSFPLLTIITFSLQLLGSIAPLRGTKSSAQLNQ